MPTFKKEVVLQKFELFPKTWFVRIYVGNRSYRFYKLDTLDPTLAQQKAFERWENIQKQLEAGTNLKLTTRKLFFRFLDYQEKEVERGKVAPATFSCKKSQIINGILPYLALKGIRNPEKMNPNRDWREYPNYRLDEGLNPSTINNEVITIREAFKWFRREEYVEYDIPYIEIFTIDQRKRDESNPPIPVDDFVRIKKWLDDYVKQEIVTRFSDKLKGRHVNRERFARELFRHYCLTMTAAALRPHEWRELTWGMIEFKKDSTEINIPYWCKTGRRLVVCWLPELCKLKQLQEEIGIEVTDDTKLGLNPDTKEAFSPPSYTNRWMKMKDDLELDYTEYSMRASGICSRLEAGVPVFTVSKWAGNSVKVIERYYTASIMKSAKMKAEVLRDTRRKWRNAGILFGNNEDYIIKDLD